MNPTEQELSAALRARAGTDAPPAPLAEMIRDGHARHHRRRRMLVVGTAVATALVVLAVGIPLALTHGHDATPTDRPAPVKGGPAIPYLHDGALHVDGHTIPTNANEVIAAGSSVLVTRFSVDSPVRRWRLLVDDELVPQPALDNVLNPIVSPDGNLVTWTSYPDRRTTRITAWDPHTRQEVAHIDLDAPFAEATGGGQQVEIQGVDDTGRIYYAFQQPHGPQDHVWRPGHGDPQVLRGAKSLMGVGPLGPVLQRNGHGMFDISGSYGSTDASGRFHRGGVLPTDQDGVWSANGSWFAYVGDDSGAVTAKSDPTVAWVLRISDHKRTRLQLPASAVPTDMAAETASTVLVWVHARHFGHDIVRCSVTGGHCETALTGVGRRGWHFPDPIG